MFNNYGCYSRLSLGEELLIDPSMSAYGVIYNTFEATMTSDHKDVTLTLLNLLLPRLPR